MTNVTAQSRQKLTPLYEAAADYKIVNPAATSREVAAMLNCSESNLCTIMATDMWKDYWARRRQEHELLLSEGVVTRATAVVSAGLDEMQHRIAEKDVPLPSDDLTSFTELGAKVLGFIGRSTPGVGGPAGVQIFLGSVDPDLLREARQDMRSVNSVPDRGEEVAAPIGKETAPAPG